MEQEFDFLGSTMAGPLVLITGPPVPDFQGTRDPIPVQTSHVIIIYVL
jgi:hypothetical protein